MSRTLLTPFPPDPDRAKKISVAKLKVNITEMEIEIDKAVEEKDFLKAHESKQSMLKLQLQIQEIETDIGNVCQSLSIVSDVETPVKAMPDVTPKATSKSTKQGEMKKKRETLGEVTQAIIDTYEKEKL